MYLNRTLCDILGEMRDCLKTSNFSYLAGLIEEGQSMANRMEASLQDKSDAKDYYERKRKLEKEVEFLEKKVETLKEEQK